MANHKVVFELTSDSHETWGALLNNVENLQKSLGAADSQIEVVAHSKGLGMMLKKNDQMEGRMSRIAGTGVVFAACENTMRRMNVSKDALMPFVRPVDSGVAEVVRKQEAGWSYIKSGL